jgi:hypothetical protein
MEDEKSAILRVITKGEARFSLCERPSVTSETPKVKRETHGINLE